MSTIPTLPRRSCPLKSSQSRSGALHAVAEEHERRVREVDAVDVRMLARTATCSPWASGWRARRP
jgi:hypothetical protein